MKNIATKMVQALAAIDAVEKRGRNQAQGYGYVKATDVANEVRKALHEAGVAFTYRVLSERFWTLEREGKATQFFCSLHVQGTFTDAESGEQLISSAIGWGADTQDKAAYKAMTGALKYLLRTTFLIPDEQDPENDKEAAVNAEIERQKVTPISSAPPPDLEWSYNKASGVLICKPLDVKKVTNKKGTEFVVVTLNGVIDGRNEAFYFHKTHAAELLESKGKICKFMVIESTTKAGKSSTAIDLVLEVDGKMMPIKEESSDNETQARLLASVLDYSDEQLRELFSSYCKGNWAMTVDVLKQHKASRESPAEPVEI